MSKTHTAKLLNRKGRVTLHQCLHLVVHEAPRRTGTVAGRNAGIYPIYKCSETGLLRIFGCLDRHTTDADLHQLFPDVPIVMGRRSGRQDYDEQAA